MLSGNSNISDAVRIKSNVPLKSKTPQLSHKAATVRGRVLVGLVNLGSILACILKVL